MMEVKPASNQSWVKESDSEKDNLLGNGNK